MKAQLLRIVIASFIATAFIASPAAQAQVAVGQKPQLEGLPLVGGGTLSLSKLKGRLVLIDFWATWCGPCMKEAPHMVELNEKLGPKGLQIVGISLDRDLAALQRVVKEQKFTWPQHVDQGGKIAGQFQVQGIPHVYLLGPDGTVLWHGHPAAGMDDQITKAFKEHPPKLVDEKVLAQGRELVTAAAASLKAGDAASAIKSMGKVSPAARQDEDFAAQYAEVSKSLQTAAQRMLADVEPLVKQGSYVEAINRLRDLSAGLTGLPVAADAKKRLAEVQAMPEAKLALDKAQKESTSAEAIAPAVKLKQAGKHESAYPIFRTVAKTYPGTPAGAQAAAAVAEYEKDKAFVARVMEREAGVKAKGAISMARAYAKNSKFDQARQKYRSVIDEYPGTSAAATAQQELAALPKN